MLQVSTSRSHKPFLKQMHEPSRLDSSSAGFRRALTSLCFPADMSEGTVGNMAELGITESFQVKRQVLLSASEAAEMILRVDNIIKAAPRSVLKTCCTRSTIMQDLTRFSMMMMMMINQYVVGRHGPGY